MARVRVVIAAGVALVVALLLTFAAWGICHAGEHPGAESGDRRDAAASPDWSLWLPSESWPGGEQYDPRLERRVNFWGAGMPLRDVFGGVKEQTGVEIGFWPPGDDNERICVNLYLNPDDPPTLRELMAQLRWVTDCGFGFRVSGEEEEEPSYCLLATSMAGGVRRRLQAEQDATVSALRARSKQLRSDYRQKLAEKLPEVREALSMSREELIEQYKGVDDLLLLALLDPARRRLVEFVSGLPQADLDALLQGQQVRRRWGEWTPKQRWELGAILESGLDYWGAGEYKLRAEQGTLNWEAELPLEVVVEDPRAGSLRVCAHVLSEEDRSAGRAEMSGPDVRLVEQQGPWYVKETIALREALGEAVTPGEREALYREREESYQAISRAWRQESMKQTLEDRLSAQRPLSPEAEALLSSFALPEAFGDGCSLWQIQEAVASASGMHVVSDCFWQPRRDLRAVIDLMYPEEQPEMTALLALRLSSLSTVAPERLYYWHPNNDRAGWEWDDAGQFLRFRHLARDLWRAAFLSETAVREVDGWLGPYVTTAVESEKSEIAVEVTVDLREASRIACQLDDSQLYHGAKVNYGDPSDETEAYRQEMREAVLVGAISRSAGIFRLFGTFSEDQWERVWGLGLRWGKDLTPSQQAMEVSNYFSPFREQMLSIVMRLHEGPLTHGLGGVEMPDVKDMYVLQFSRDWEQADEDLPPGLSGAPPPPHFTPELPVPRTIVVHLRRPEGLVALTAPGQEGEKAVPRER